MGHTLRAAAVPIVLVLLLLLHAARQLGMGLQGWLCCMRGTTMGLVHVVLHAARVVFSMAVAVSMVVTMFGLYNVVEVNSDRLCVCCLRLRLARFWS